MSYQGTETMTAPEFATHADNLEKMYQTLQQNNEEAIKAVLTDLKQPSIDVEALLKKSQGLVNPLEPIINRFAKGWGATLDIGVGWWPIVIALDEQIAKQAPDYQIHQIKEKFGGLRYYWEPNFDYEWSEDNQPPEPPDNDDYNGKEWQQHDEDVQTWEQQDKIQAIYAEYNKKAQKAHEYEKAAEYLCAVTCEKCGGPGELQSPGGRDEQCWNCEGKGTLGGPFEPCDICAGTGTIHITGGWLKTVCNTCRPQNYVPVNGEL